MAEQTYNVDDPTKPKPPDAAPSSPDPFAAMGGGVQIAGGGWVPKNHPLAQQAATPAPAAPAAPAQAAPAAPAPGSDPAAPPATIADAFKKSLISTLSAQPPVTAQNPAIAPAIQANQLAEQRGLERNQNLLAERAAANGTNNSGGFESQLLGLAQDRAAREGQFAGDAVQHLQDQQNGNLMRALGLAGAAHEGEQTRTVQQIMQDKSLSQQDRLAQLDAALRREGLSAQTALGQGDLSLRSRLGEGQLNLGLLQALLGNDFNNRSLDQQGAQFGAGLDQQGLLALLGGL